MPSVNDNCPCGQNMKLKNCCGKYIFNGESPSTPEELMRSRYTAYVLMDIPYLKKTWHPETRPDDLDSMEPTRWAKLEVLNHKTEDHKGYVEFIAKYFEGLEVERKASSFLRMVSGCIIPH